MKANTVEGHYTCEHCGIDKCWSMSVDGGREKDIIAAAKRQRKEVSDVAYSQPPHKLIYTIRYGNKERSLVL